MRQTIWQACSYLNSRTVILLITNKSFIGARRFYGYNDMDSMGSFGPNKLWTSSMPSFTTPFRASKRFLGSASAAALLLAFSPAAFAQVVVSDARTAPLETDGEDLTIESGGSVTLENAGPALVLNSDNDLTLDGTVAISDVNDAVGVELQGGADRNYTQRGSITLDEDFSNPDTDEDGIPDGPFAEGSGRTGILISGASPFEGNVELTAASSVNVEGTDSFGINLTNTSMAQNGLTGDLTQGGQILVRGDNSVGINVASGIGGNFTQNGTITTTGENTVGINIDADIQGGFVNSGAATNTGYRFATRVGLGDSLNGGAGRQTLQAEDLLQAGSAIRISGNIGGGIYLDDGIDNVFDEDGVQQFNDEGAPLLQQGSQSAIVQNGSAPAILLDGDGTPIAIGLVAAITDPDAEGFDEDLQYAFVNQGSLQANGVYDLTDATAFSAIETTLEGGINNTGSMTATTFVAPRRIIEGADPATPLQTGIARVIVLGPNAIAEQINNSGIILATSSEAADVVFADPENPLARTDALATAISIESLGQTSSLTNSGTISAIIVSRQGTAYAIRDQSGTLTTLNNTGSIAALGTSSDGSGESETEFNLIAIDVSRNETGFTLVQNRAEDLDLDDDITPRDPSIIGDVRFGSADDSLTVTAGLVLGDVDFGQGDDTLALSGNSELRGALSNREGLTISVAENSALSLTEAGNVAITSASFDGTSTFSPILDGTTGTASTLAASGDITFADGATVSPTLTNVVGIDRTAFTIAQAGGTLSVGNLASLASTESPYLFDTSYTVDGNDLVITLDLRDAEALALDGPQTGAYDQVITALRSNTDLGDAFANITSQSDFNAAYNQILPEFGAAARQFVLANVDGATGAVANHLDSTRRSPDKPGGAWLQEFAYFADRDLAGQSEQYRGTGFGFAAGLDTAIGPFHAVGLSVGFASTEIEDVVGIDEPLDVVTLQGGAYAGWASGNLGIEAYAGGGYNDFEQNRRVRINTFSGQAQGDWSGTHINGSVRAGYDVELNEKFWFRPTVSLDYLRLSESAFTETGTAGVALDVDKRTSETASATAMFNLGAKFQGKRTWIRPSIRAGYRQEFLNDPVKTSFRYAGLLGSDGQSFNSETANLQSLLFPDSGFIVGFSVAAGSAYSSIGFDVDSEIRDGFIRHTGRVVVRLLF